MRKVGGTIRLYTYLKFSEEKNEFSLPPLFEADLPYICLKVFVKIVSLSEICIVRTVKIT